jgi:hypothetical protein
LEKSHKQKFWRAAFFQRGIAAWSQHTVAKFAHGISNLGNRLVAQIPDNISSSKRTVYRTFSLISYHAGRTGTFVHCVVTYEQAYRPSSVPLRAHETHVADPLPIFLEEEVAA